MMEHSYTSRTIISTTIYIIFILQPVFHLSASCIFTISNNCPYAIWPGTLAGAGTSQLSTTGFRLNPGHSVGLAAPLGWSGWIWGRQTTSGRRTTADIQLHVMISSDCPKALQVVDSNGGAVACKSACEAFGLNQYCCSGEFANPSSCKPSYYSGIFKNACPRAYSYAFDDRTSTFTI